MQSSGQQPAENMGQHNGGVEDVQEQASSPLYEFPADNFLSQDTPRAQPVTYQSQRDDLLKQPAEGLVQQGLIYPPPPAYYQNLQMPPVRPALPGSQAQLYPAGVQIPPYPNTQFPGMQQPAKKSHKWVWIVVSIFSAAFLVSCGLCGWAFYQLFNTTYQQESGAIDVVNNYFQQVQNQRYAIAYQDLQISGLTQDDYITNAQASDSQNGLLRSFVVERPTFATNPASGPDLSQWRITVDVTRANVSFPVLLTVQNVGGSWKIIYIDRY
jgi:hypothetical protein